MPSGLHGRCSNRHPDLDRDHKHAVGAKTVGARSGEVRAPGPVGSPATAAACQQPARRDPGPPAASPSFPCRAVPVSGVHGGPSGSDGGPTPFSPCSTGRRGRGQRVQAGAQKAAGRQLSRPAAADESRPGRLQVRVCARPMPVLWSTLFPRRL